MSNKVYFSVCGEGYGHSSRDMAIAKILISNGADLLIGSYGYVLDRLNEKFDTAEIEREFEMVGNEGVFDLKETIYRSKFSALSFPRIIFNEKKIIENFKATCVVVDGRSAAVFAAFKLGIPCIIISNQTILEPFFKNNFFLQFIIGKPIELIYKISIILAEEVLIPDLPPPHTICIDTLSKSRKIMKKQHFIGPIVSLNFKKSCLPCHSLFQKAKVLRRLNHIGPPLKR